MDNGGRHAGFPEGAPPGASSPGEMLSLVLHDGCDGADLTVVARHLFETHCADAGEALARACRRVAAVVASWGGHPYHSALHHAEVATVAMRLAGTRAMTPTGRATLLLACLGHDLFFDPSSARAPFRLEARAAEAVDALASRAGMDAETRLRCRTLILATEPSARPLLRAMAEGRRVALPVELEPLADDRGQLLAATIVSDADLLPSAGLTPARSLDQCGKLSQETGHPVTADGFVRFLDSLVGRGFVSPAGRAFDGDLARIRAWAASGMEPADRGPRR